ncbi:sulfur carrier protein ThiS [Nocardioides salarius]|jgi:sulfur carrier protein|uniref:Sulfur carrier protein n=1 Tax=Nocardioides salarius TaxID=374513 RepID=A0ABS2M833_9ACTN|nr:sulfur carrier protein ThiS [Nocardioides salarius]MBM7507352.1 sulfur carrier protein [Nocardioides salarius]
MRPTEQILLNGRPAPLVETVRDLVPDPDGRAVAVNGDVVPRAEHASRRLRAGDVVDVVTAVQGG